MRIFITGATGFIGRHLVNKLKNDTKNKLLLLSRKPQKSPEYIQGDLSNIGRWGRSVKIFNPDVVVHLAWQGLPDLDVATSIKNLKYGLNLFQFLAKNGCKTIIALGSCWEYGCQKGKMTEESGAKPILIENIFNSFSGQYIIAIGKLVKNSNSKNIAIKNNDSEKIIKTFLINAKQKDIEIKSIINKIDGPFTIWGVAGKGVIFVNLLKDEMRSRIPFLIDIDPDKQNKYTPGTGHKIMGPSALIRSPVNNILIMNPNYYKEIFNLLKSIKQKCNLVKIT